MKSGVLYIILLVFGGFQHLFGQNPDQKGFSLSECIDYALKHNNMIANASLEENISETTIGETRAEGLPQLNGSINYSFNPAVQQQVIPNFLAPAIYQVLEEEELATMPNGGDFGEIPVGFGTANTGRADLILTQLIFKGSYFVGLQAAKTYRELARKSHISTKIDVVESVTKAYYTVLVNKERVSLMDANYGRLDTLLNETRAMYENGFAEKIDVDRIQVNFNNIKTQRLAANRILKLSYLLLKYQMGMPIGEDFDIEGDLSEIDFDFSFEAINNFNYNNRIQFSQLQTNKALVQLDLRNNKVQYFPDLSGFVNYGYTMGTNSAEDIFDFNKTWYKYASLGLNLNIPLFDGLRKSYKIQKNKIQMLQLEKQEQELKNSIDLEIRQYQIALQNSIENLEAQQENMELAKGIFDATTIKYQEGIGSNLEVVEAETAYKEAETNYFSALYDALIAKVDLEKALGILIK